MTAYSRARHRCSTLRRTLKTSTEYEAELSKPTDNTERLRVCTSRRRISRESSGRRTTSSANAADAVGGSSRYVWTPSRPPSGSSAAGSAQAAPGRAATGTERWTRDRGKRGACRLTLSTSTVTRTIWNTWQVNTGALTYQQSVYKRHHSDKQFSEFYIRDGGKNQQTQIWNDYYVTVTLCILVGKHWS